MTDKVAIYKLHDAAYPPPTDLCAQSEAYRKYIFKVHVSKRPNKVYKAVRETLQLLDMDKECLVVSETGSD